jgi:Ni2+-binding GTPase involved in maturation of urease and hydrogenase
VTVKVVVVGCAAILIPVTVLTGYLGSGKTTLLRRLLHQHAQTPLRLAVIENEVHTAPPTERTPHAPHAPHARTAHA